MQAAHHLGSLGGGSSETRSSTVALDSWAATQLGCGDLTTSRPVLRDGLLPVCSRNRLSSWVHVGPVASVQHGAKSEWMIEHERVSW
jgi:hypothetical protein